MDYGAFYNGPISKTLYPKTFQKTVLKTFSEQTVIDNPIFSGRSTFRYMAAHNALMIHYLPCTKIAFAITDTSHDVKLSPGLAPMYQNRKATLLAFLFQICESIYLKYLLSASSCATGIVSTTILIKQRLLILCPHVEPYQHLHIGTTLTMLITVRLLLF